MIRFILRRATEAASPSSFSYCRAVVAAVSSLETLMLYHQSSTAYVRHFSSHALLDGTPSSYPAGVRRFHGLTLPLRFRETTAASAEFAMADYGSYVEDRSAKGSGAGGHGLEIAKLGIEEEIVSALAKKGITKLFPIQKAVLDPAMQGRDMIGRARTGTGKTLAFGIPIMDKVLKFNAKHGKGRNPLGLILAPTRELARQVEKEFYESAPNLDTICVYGGTPIQRQIRQLDYGVDIVVGTPGRVIDLIKRGALNLSEVQFAVLDEADQMLAVGFEEDVETILKNLPQNRQSMMFSATMPNWIKGLTRKYLKDPLTIDLVGDSNQKLADGISLYAIASDLYGKASIIGPLITEHAKGGKCIVFTQTKRDADRLAYAMAKSYRCEALHGDISQAQRERTLSGFREGHFSILVATDVAARGLDIPNVDLVVHYELPNSPEIFVHRSGRTGRAGKKGSAILIYTQDQHRDVRIIEREVGCKFTELPKIAVDGASIDVFSMGGGGRYNCFGGGRDRRSGDFRFGRGQRGSDFARGGGYPSSNYSGSNSNRFGSFGGRSSGSSGGGFGSSSSNRSGGFGGSSSGRPSGFDDFGSDHRSKSFGDFGSNQRSRFGDFGSESSGGSRSSGLGRSNLFGDNNSSRHDGPGDSSASRSGNFGGNRNDGDRRSRK